MAANSQTIGLGAIIRMAFIVCAVVMTVVLLLWIRDEQRHVQRCGQVVQSQQANSTMTPAPPIRVVVHLGASNGAGNGTATPLANARWNYNWDRKQWVDRKDAEGVQDRTILMIRQGQHDVDTGRLNARGHQQVNLTATRLKELNFRYNRIVHSNLQGAALTALLIRAYLPKLPIFEDPLLAEGGSAPAEQAGSYSPLPNKKYLAAGPRLEAAFRNYIYRADREQMNVGVDILVADVNIIRYFVLRALQLPTAASIRLLLPHASISRLNIRVDGTVSLDQFGDSGHMPPDYVTY